MKNFVKNIVSIAIFLSLMAMIILLWGLEGSGHGLKGWAVTIVSSVASWGLIRWVYRTNLGKNRKSQN